MLVEVVTAFRTVLIRWYYKIAARAHRDFQVFGDEEIPRLGVEAESSASSLMNAAQIPGRGRRSRGAEEEVDRPMVMRTLAGIVLFPALRDRR